MPTSRSESIKQYQSHSSSIRDPEHDTDPLNKQDHYAVLAQIVTQGLEKFVDFENTANSLQSTDSLPRLSNALHEKVGQFVRLVLYDEDSTEHRENLEHSQYLRHFFNASRWESLPDSVNAGIKTFTEIFSLIFQSLSRIDIETATHPNNWKVADKLAKLNIQQIAAYARTYMYRYQNWPAMMDHFEITADAGVAFKPGYPDNALINIKSSQPNPQGYDIADFDLTDTESLITLKEVALDEPTIGCPITFDPHAIKALWHIYARNAYRIARPLATTDDTEAFVQ